MMILRSMFLRLVLIPIRFARAISYYGGPLKNILVWLVRSKEHTNYTYDLSPLNKKYLSSFISLVGNISIEQSQRYIAELENNEDLKSHIRSYNRASRRNYLSDDTARYSRRLGWYALVRSMKPKIVVESGTDKGLGACVIAAALKKNDEEGYPGYVYCIDINPVAGYLLADVYAEYGKVLYGDSVEVLQNINENIDIFIEDSYHNPNYELLQYRTIRTKLSDNAILIADNAHSCDALFIFAQEISKRFLFFQEEPNAHWYPGGGIGVAY